MVTIARMVAGTAVLAILFASSIAFGQAITGRGTAQDGDDLVVNGTRIRLHGMDAFELDQTCKRADGTQWPCGQEAKRMLNELVSNKVVRCDRVQATLSNGRPVMRCFVDQMELNAEMVRRGLALDCPPFSNGRYKATEAQAKADKEGAWTGTFTAPWVHKGKIYCCSPRHPREFCPLP